eukprot:CAMPEP_0178606380 /NCGR_PEP_ID=MMETSP0697-20121206/37056_1 /TAXON_ID=265572 /ORGANISM="Extubocellulus spinifer, Strain CCMP396" /LENGTH=126 /DNA_ID=CAMNT_0020244833 /DNA_START=62 /DNA_END=442 /DNA_ORIENTATION=-
MTSIGADSFDGTELMTNLVLTLLVVILASFGPLKSTVISMGNIFYALLTEYWPFEGMEEKKAQEMILSGERPHVDAELLNSKDSADVALIEAMRMCWRQDPIDRATATDVKQYLTAAMKRSQRKQE